MPGNYEILSSRVIARYIAPLVDRRQNPLPQNLTLLNRTPEVERTDGEIVASTTGTVFAADIIADDQEAVVRAGEDWTLQQSKIPNLKHGHLLTQEMLNLLDRVNNGTIAAGEDNILRSYVTRQYDNLIRGINVRKEAMLWQMAINSGSYDRLGIKFSGLSWGMPADLQLNVGTLWSNTASTPISDIQNHQAAISAKYGKTYNRLTISTQDFTNLTKTDEFKARLQLYSTITLPAGALPTSDVGLMTTMVGRILNLTVEINDFQMREQSTAGPSVYTRFLPLGYVVLSSTSDDNNPLARDIANAVVTESVVGNLPGVNVLGGLSFGGPRVGPVGYATPKTDLNPPNIRLWAVQRCIPEKNDKTETAVLKVA